PPWLPGPALGSFLAAATVLRTDAFRTAGGFHPRLWLGGEEELLAADLAADGWWLTYADHLAIHHQASVARDPTLRRRHGIRNTLWFTWLRRPPRTALRRTLALARSVPRDTTSLRAFAEAAAALPWVLRERRVLPHEVESRLRLLEPAQRTSTARRYTGWPRLDPARDALGAPERRVQPPDHRHSSRNTANRVGGHTTAKAQITAGAEVTIPVTIRPTDKAHSRATVRVCGR